MTGPAGVQEGTGNLSTKDADEELARLFLTSVLCVPVTVRDRRSGRSTYDLEICYPGGRRDAAEVVSTRTQEHAAQLAAVSRAGYTVDRRLTQSWIARVPSGTRIGRVRPVLPEFLNELEQNGITDLSSYRDYGPGMRERLHRLHVSSCLAYEPTDEHPPGFYVYPEATACWVGDGEGIPRFCEEFLRHPAQSDVLAKLATAGTSERHAVIIATSDQFGLHTAVDMGRTPSQPPDLDERVDWLWVITSQAPPALGCYWPPQGG